MSDFAEWLYFLAGFAALPILAVASIYLHFNLKKRSTLVLAGGLIVATGGEFLQLLAPLRQPVSYEQVLDMSVAHGQFSTIWHVGGAIFAVGILVTCVGFVWLAISARRLKGRDI